MNDFDARSYMSAILGLLETEMRARRYRGWVVPLSGGIDSSVVLMIAARAHPRALVGVALPDRHSSPDSERLARVVARDASAGFLVRPITDVLNGLGCYKAQAAAISRDFREFDETRHVFRVAYVEDFASADALPQFRLQVLARDRGTLLHDQVMSTVAYLGLVAATNMKQRTRMLMAHHIAEEHNLGVLGTSNRLEWEQGFVVKYGDATGDVLPLRRLLKRDVYALAEYLGVPNEVRQRTPTTDTYSAEQTQEDFYYGLSIERSDQLWELFTAGVGATEASTTSGLGEKYVENVFAAFRRRQASTIRLREATLDDNSKRG